MQALFKNKAFLAIVILFIIGAFAYRMFSPNTGPDLEGESALSIGKDLIDLSAQLSRAQLSQTLFSSPSYIMLTDFTAPIPQQSLGRNNPFDIIGRD